jgi:diaminopimelate epimerase
MSNAVPTLTKHHGLGNDFLVLADFESRWPIDERLARRLCDRRRGIGADGLIRVTPTGRPDVVRMELRNADGSSAEMSGNGIRCLAQAVVHAGWTPPGRMVVLTEAGERSLTLSVVDDNLAMVEVAMGVPSVRVVDEEPEPRHSPAVAARVVEVGNPHLVLLVVGDEALGSVDLAGLGPSLEASRPGGQNVEWISQRSEASLVMRVWERGAGITDACGTGSVAVAAAARAWGLVPERVTVANPGGDLLVDLSGAEALLVGPAVLVGSVEPAPGLFEPAEVTV